MAVRAIERKALCVTTYVYIGKGDKFSLMLLLNIYIHIYICMHIMPDG